MQARMNIVANNNHDHRAINSKQQAAAATSPIATVSTSQLSNQTISSQQAANNKNTAKPQHKLASKMTNYSANYSVRLVASLALVVLIASVISIECQAKRTQYHEQGLHGPKSYKFGYTSGDHKNPQERHEISDGHGHVKGWYSFIDGSGKHQVIHYEAHPKYGFKVFNHKSKAYNTGKRHYGS